MSFTKPATTRRGRWWVIGALCLASFAGALTACGSDSSGSARSGDQPSAQDKAELLTWAGFTDVADLEILAVEEMQGIDYALNFIVRGSAANIDRAMAVAHFEAEPEDGIHVHQPALSGFNLDELANPQSMDDQWTNPAGKSIFRSAVRGTTPNGDVMVQVWAFTT